MGEGLGHLVAIAELAKLMIANGHRVTCVLKDISQAYRWLGGSDIRWLQAPRIFLQPAIAAPANHAELLYNVGYRTPDTVGALLLSWRTILEALRPDRVICDFAPTASWVARALGFDVVALDNGFSMPPLPAGPDEPLPAIRPHTRRTRAELLTCESTVLAIVNLACNSAGLRALPRFASLYEGNVLYRNWPQFNHFGPHAADRHVGQIVGQARGPVPTWSEGNGPKMFAYLKPGHPDSVPLLMAAAAYGFRIVAFIPDVRPDAAARLKNIANLTWSDRPYDLSKLPHDIAIGVWHSATAAIARCLPLGMRLLFLPMHAEQHLACLAVARSAVAAHVCTGQEAWNDVFTALMDRRAPAANDAWVPADLPLLAQRLQ